eukprot:TRINITY_DN2818_c0_g1_i3.p1 TRINITY_DN2818_c0_g1~~TRINITY_DN2818_c0_g1_i3.p1  ORF type:complete len:512 (-),score=99.94 TRINITY_DN2818_c0_g1_i3:222-1757(-)
MLYLRLTIMFASRKVQYQLRFPTPDDPQRSSVCVADWKTRYAQRIDNSRKRERDDYLNKFTSSLKKGFSRFRRRDNKIHSQKIVMEMQLSWKVDIVDDNGRRIEVASFSFDESGLARNKQAVMFQHMLHLRPRLSAEALIPLTKIKEISVSGHVSNISTKPRLFYHSEKFISERRPFGISKKPISEAAVSSWEITCEKEAIILYTSSSLRFAVGVWKDSRDICFLSASMPYPDIMKQVFSVINTAEWEKKLGPQLSTMLRPHAVYFDDLDSKFGLHDYTLHIEIRSGTKSVWTMEFSSLFASYQQGFHDKQNREHMYAALVIVDREHDDGSFDQGSLTQKRFAFTSKLCFPWQTVAFSGSLDRTTTVDICLYDERGMPMILASRSIALEAMSEFDPAAAYTGPDAIGREGGSYLREQSEGELLSLRFPIDERCTYNFNPSPATHGRRSTPPNDRMPLALLTTEILHLNNSAEKDLNMILDMRLWMSYNLIDSWHGTKYALECGAGRLSLSE